MDFEPLVEELAVQAVRSYRRRVPWLDVEDLTQEARAVLWRAVRTWDPVHGVPFEIYGHRAAVVALKHYLIRQGSPVSSRHDSDNLKGLSRTSLEALISHAAPLDLEDVVTSALWRTRVLHRLCALFANDAEREVTLGILLRGEKPGQVGRRLGLTMERVYRITRRVRAKARGDYELWRLWKDLE